MNVERAYNFPLPGFWSDLAVAEQVCITGGRRYLLRQLGAHLLYRVTDCNWVAHTLFVPFRHSAKRGEADPLSRAGVSLRDGSAVPPLRPALTSPVYSESVFAQQLANGENGRLALYSCSDARDCSPLLFFRQDGTGFFLDYQTANGYSAHEPAEQVDFTWNGKAHGINPGADILTAGWPQIEALCQTAFTSQVWPRMKDPFVSYAETPDAPLLFLCGSQQELFTITNCIFHTHPGEWAELEARMRSWLIENHCLPIVYEAVRAEQPGGTAKHWPKRISALCQLAFQHNTFTGYKWAYRRYEGRTRRNAYKAEPLKQTCLVAPPSAHERAEALLTLYDWLEGKVTEEERQKYLGLERE